MKLKIYSVLAALAMLVSAVSCSDSDKWEPGEPDAPDCAQAFFAVGNDLSYEFFSFDKVKTIPVTVRRLKTADPLSLPLTLTTEATGVKIPATAEFAAGQEEVTVFIDCAEMPERQTYRITVSMPDSYYAMYGQGCASIDVDVTVVAWTVLCDNVESRVYDSNDVPLYPSTYGTLEWLEGTNRLRLTNYCGSGLPFMFYLSASNSGYSSEDLDMVPLDNAYLEEKSDYGCYYIYDSANGQYPSWSLDGGTSWVSDFYIYRAGFSYLNMTDPSDGFARVTGYLDMEDGSSPWVNTWIYFTIPDEYVGLIPIEGVE